MRLRIIDSRILNPNNLLVKNTISLLVRNANNGTAEHDFLVGEEHQQWHGEAKHNTTTSTGLCRRIKCPFTHAGVT